MIVGIGVDIAETNRFEKLFDRYGQRFANRILTDLERKEFTRRRYPASFLATRFAAKEAAAKALGTGFANGVGYQSIEIENDANGKPVLCFLKLAKSLAEEKQVLKTHLSLSDEKQHVVAMVILEG